MKYRKMTHAEHFAAADAKGGHERAQVGRKGTVWAEMDAAERRRRERNVEITIVFVKQNIGDGCRHGINSDVRQKRSFTRSTSSSGYKNGSHI